MSAEFKNAKEAWHLVAQAETREEYFDLAKRGDPKSYVLFHDKLEYYADKKFAPKVPVFSPRYTEFVRVPQEMRTWAEVEFVREERPKTLVVWGRSRTGKTSWARSLGSHCYLAGYWNADQIDTERDFVIFDDIPFKTFLNWQAFFGE